MFEKSILRVEYRLAQRGELARGRAVDMVEWPGGRVTIALAPAECSDRLAAQCNKQSGVQFVTGKWRRRETKDTVQADFRWDRVARHQLPNGCSVAAIEQEGSLVWAVDENDCTHRLQVEVNELLKRCTRDLWTQHWAGPRAR